MEPRPGTAPANDPHPGAWRALLGVTGAVLLVWGLHNALLLPWEKRHLAASVREPLLLAARVVVWILPIRAYLARFDRRPWPEALAFAPREPPTGRVRAAVVAVVYLGLVGLLAFASAEKPPDGGAFLRWLASLPALWMLILVVLEEVLWRGFLLGQLLRHVGPKKAQIAVALGFALMHLPGFIALQGLHVGLVPSTIVLTILGLVLGAVTRGTGSLWAAIAVHCANNLLAQWTHPD